jgi:hypothetical protein
MPAFFSHVITTHPQPTERIASAFNRIALGIAAWRQMRQLRARELNEIFRLRQLEPYLLNDAGIDASLLNSSAARIAEARDMFYRTDSARSDLAY